MRPSKYIAIPIIILFLSETTSAFQDPIEIRGLITDDSSGEPLPGVTIRVIGRSALTVRSDPSGIFGFPIQQLPVSLVVSKAGYEQVDTTIAVRKTGPLYIGLKRVPIPLTEIVVTATRQQHSAIQSPVSVTVIPRGFLDRAAGSSLGAAVEGVSGLFMRSLGGANSIKTVSLRGMYSEHTLVLIDGQRYNSFQNSQIDFGILPVAGIERVEIVKGGFSAVYGADAIGGVINVIGKKPKESMTAHARYAIGSYGLQEHGLVLGDKYGSVAWQGRLYRERGRGDYKFRYDDGSVTTTLRRAGADFDILTGDLRFDYELSQDMRSRLSLSYSRANRGTPGVVTSPSVTGSARLMDEIGRAHASMGWRINPQVTTNLNSSFVYSRQTFRDPQLLIGGLPTHSVHTNRMVFISPELQLVMSPRLSGVIGVEAGAGSLISTDAGKASRWQRSVYASTRHSVELTSRFFNEIILYPSVRYDDFSDIAGDLSPKIGLNLAVSKDPVVHLRSSYGKSYRVPTFNELYWKIGGNPNLRPERSLSFDAGVIAKIDVLGSLSLEVNYFSISTRERIIWTPGRGGIWSPRNLAEVESKGVEAEARWTGFDEMLTLSANSTWNNVRKQSEDFSGDPTRGKFIPYVPRQVVNLSATCSLDQWTLSVRNSWVSFRYSSEINDRFLPAYSVTTAAARFVFPVGPVQGVIKIEGTNLFNSSYEVIPLFPMPLSEYKISIGADI